MTNVVPLPQRPTTPAYTRDTSPPALAPHRYESDQDATVTVADVRPAVYTVPEVATLLTISRGNAYAMVRAGQIPAMRLGARWVIPKRRFHAWLDNTDPADIAAQTLDALSHHRR